ncbi:MAG: hypothetical protein IKY02_02890 [Lachnospiraceae bacterium]|nr:hypothetical protein [Lachnospiraceae bacterium]MBR5738917.1 hypothetical protein [Lachnospiraceae bacterium]
MEERFDMALPPKRNSLFWKNLATLLCLPDIAKHKPLITKNGTEGLKPPYLLLCNHNAFQDFKVALKCVWPARWNFVVAIDGFIGREWLLRDLGCICKRKFTNDVLLIRHLKTVLKNGDVAAIYPEARYSLCGTTAVLPEALGKLCKMLKVPVVTLICHGHHINSPFWNLHDRGVKPTEAEFSLLFTPEDLKVLPVGEINEKLVQAFQYDEYAWQKEKGIRVTYEKRAEGLQKVLYQCPVCGKEYRMAAEGTKLYCRECGAAWTMEEDGTLTFQGAETDRPFTGKDIHIPDWYEWERANVRKEVEAGTYSTGELPVHVDSLPNAKKYIPIGKGTMVHDMDGFRVRVTDEKGETRTMEIKASTQYSVHVEYEYLGKYGDCVDLNTLTDTWYTYPENEDFSVTKMSLATEEIYQKICRDKGKILPPGLA